MTWFIATGVAATFPREGDSIQVERFGDIHGRCSSAQGFAEIMSPVCSDGSMAEAYVDVPGTYIVSAVEPMTDVSGLRKDPVNPDRSIIRLK